MFHKMVFWPWQGLVGQNNLPSFVMEGARGASNNAAKHTKRKSPVQTWRPISTAAVPRKGDLGEISNSGSKQVVENFITGGENLASDGTTNVVIEVTASNTSSSDNNFIFGSTTTKVVIEDSMEVTGFNKDPYGSDISKKIFLFC